MLLRRMVEKVYASSRPSREFELCEAMGASSVTLGERIAKEVQTLLASPEDNVVIRASQTAGLGVFAAKECPAGSGLTAYPGICFNDLSRWSASGRVDDSYLLVLGTHAAGPAGCVDALDAPRACAKAAGHLVNHPPPGHKPNVLPAAFRWPHETRHNATATDDDALTGALIVARRDLKEGDELFLDYRLAATTLFGHKTISPDWYEPVTY